METIIVAILGVVGTVIGSYLSNRKSSALIAYRLERLEEKVNLHNQVVERTYELEKSDAIQVEQLKVMNHRILDLENEPKE